ncbi:polysaccharide biosynthesis protein [Thermacetogenium phaeum DSM 12270]|uniref:Polysaccharide biosynthesis protein n=1 Tax=Thermacetogenium phaeum (strain ATCC BAA-254 / DSM 26808 / PB) TaxID=1089553 RepID=K4LCN4_THEPS|nr:oligosaccharide flippase family protein [Thermacetogenium phaeum]AFV10518.1 polysaccharide biosynthesis protein [Thermacetogenium phaeum DSM 12270]
MLIKNTLLYLVARGVPGIINFLAIAIYTRLLSPEEFGKYTLVIAWVSLCNVVLFQWLRQGLFRFLPAHLNKNRPSLLTTILTAFIGLSLFVGIINFILIIFLPENGLRILLAVGFILLISEAWHELNLTFLSTKLEPLRYGIMSLSKAVIALLVGWYLASKGYGAFGLLYGLIIGLLIPTINNIYREWRKINFTFFDRSIIQNILSYGLPLTATFALNFIVSSSDRIMLGWLVSTEAAGLYAAGYDLANQTLVMLMMVVNLAAYPLALWSLEQKGYNVAQIQLKKNGILLLAVAMPAAAGLVILAPNIAGVMLGESFRKTAAEIIPLISLGALCMGLKAYYFDLCFQLGRRTQGQMFVSLASAILNLILNLWWIPLIGIYGAAYATICSYLLGLILSIKIGRKIFYMPFPGTDVFKLFLATAGMSIVLWPMADWRGTGALIAQILAGVIIYGLLFLITNVMDSRKRVLKAIKIANRLN